MQNFETFAARIIELEDAKAEYTEQIKEAISTFAEQYEVDKKVVRKGLKVYKDFIKDQAETTEFANLVIGIVFQDAENTAEEALEETEETN